MESNFCLHASSNLIWCCDIASRLNNDIQSLAHDLQILFKLQLCYKGLQKQYDQLLNQLENRLEILRFKKHQSSAENERITSIHVEEFIIFIRKVWESLIENLENENDNARFISFVRGVPLRSVVDELMNFCFHCTRTLFPKFLHQHCSQVFMALNNQLNYYVFPEVEFVDSFEQSLKFLTSSLPCLVNLLTIVDLYTYSPKYDKIESLCNDLFINNSPKEFSYFVPPRFLRLPDSFDNNPGLLTDEVDLECVSYWVPQMVSYIVKMSVVPRRFSTISSQPHGVLTSSYMACTRIFHQDTGVESHLGHERRRKSKSLGRKGSAKDLNPIKLPKLSIQPFAY